MSPNTTDAPFIKDAELHAYLDGELPAKFVPDVVARLVADAHARVPVASLTAQLEALQSKFPLPNDCPKTKAMMDRVLGWARR